MSSDIQRKILLAVSGMSPQIITETLYSLVREKHWIPDEIRLVTTLQGKDNAVSQLLEGGRYFQRLLDDYRIQHPIVFTEQQITVIQDENGEPLSDLRTPEHNKVAADTISAVIRELTNDPNIELHVSLAGGRKTMGFYAGYALSLFGRPQDRLSHVLVSENYESNRAFFYPTPNAHKICDRNNNLLDSSKAKVWLAEIPFVRLRGRLPKTLLAGTHSFSETVRLAREATETIQLTLFPAEKRYQVNDLEGKLSPVQMAILFWVVTKALQRQPPLAPLVEGETHPTDELDGLIEPYFSLTAKTDQALADDGGITQKWLEQNVSKLNKEIEKNLGVDLSQRCKLAIRSVGEARGYALPEDIILQIKTQVQQNMEKE